MIEEYEKELMWDILKSSDISEIWYEGNGRATKFNSAWISGATVIHVLVDDVARSAFRDYHRSGNNIIFNKPVPAGHKICVRIIQGGR